MAGKAELGATGVKMGWANRNAANWVDKKAFTKTITKGDAINVKFVDPSNTPTAKLADGLAGPIQNVTYNTDMQFYMNPQGLMTLGFAVDLQPNGMSAAPLLWRSSVYAEKPDPSFVLPKKFSFYNTRWVPNPDMLSATEMRGTLYYDNESKDKVLDNDVLTPGKATPFQSPYITPVSSLHQM